jgi:predicted exporter
MESRLHITPVSGQKIVAILIAGVISLMATSLAADTYRWKDKDGKTHYGAAVPAEYADQPYDILNKAGMVIEHIEDTTIPLEVIAKKKIKKARAPLISEETRRTQTDKLLVIRYASEEEILKAQELEIAQLGYDTKVINQSYQSTTTAIRSQISQAADQQRAGQQISPETQQKIDQLYARQAKDLKRQAVMTNRADQIRARYQVEIDRYRFLTTGSENTDQAPVDQG